MSCLERKKLIFLPGIDGSGISFEPFRRVLPESIDALVVSYPADKLLSFAESVRCAREQIGNFSAAGAIVVAESFSGLVAIELIGSGSLSPQCLVLSSAFARSPRPVLLKIINALPAEYLVSIPAPRAVMRHILKGGAPTADIFISLLNRIREIVPPHTLAHRLKLCDSVDVRGRLQSLNVPCLYLQSTADRTVPARCLNDFVERVPDLRVKRICGPHFLLQAQPRECAEAIEQFVSNLR